MKKVIALLVALVLFSGCSGTKDAQDKLLKMRSELSQKECAFSAHIHADFGENTYDFILDCRFDNSGNMSFAVNSPETISGITGKISTAGGALTFDDKAVGFCLLADGEISPVSGPWLMLKALRGGFLASWREEKGGTLITVDDSFEGSAVSFQILVSQNLQPISAEIIWKGNSILSITVENFRYL